MKHENTYIINLEAAYLYKDIIDKIEITSKKRDLNKLFSATIPYSLETIRINKMFQDTFYEVNGKQYTQKIINLTFDKPYSIWNEQLNKRVIVANKKKIRKYLYENGFIMDGIKYVFYKRGASKAKNGYALYIQEHMRRPLLDRSRLGLTFEENEEVDLTSLLAYESLISSGLDFTIDLNPKTEILLIDDVYGKDFESLASVTREENGKIVTNNQAITLKNCLTDGQGLLDQSVFKLYNKENKGFMLLRSDMFKCCAFNTKLQEWFKHNKISKLTDMFGNEYDAKHIKLVITPNSLKLFKYAYKIGSGNKKECYSYWNSNIDTTFGVVKCDKEGNYGNYNRTTYQLLNSIPNLTYNDLMELTKIERDYVTLLKNDNAVFRNYLGCDIKGSLKLEKILEDDDAANVNYFKNFDMLNALLLVNSDIQYTSKFKEVKKRLIANYIDHLKKGKIRLKDAKYVTIVSNPFEMLLATIGGYKNESIMIGREVYCKYYNNNHEFCISRNPHINAANVMYAKNVYHEEYKWFNFTDNIMTVNFFDNDMPDRLQGEDTDSDTNLIISHPILVKKALFCEENFPTPINRVIGQSRPKKYNMKELQKLDVILSNNYIGKIVNMSQIINSYMNDAIFKGEPKEIINELFQATSKLSSLSQIEIDKSKKVFENISMSKELSKIRKLPYIRYVQAKDSFGQLVDKMVVPVFFNMISSSNEYRVYERFNTPLDILQDVLSCDVKRKCKSEKSVEFIDLLVKPKDLSGLYQTTYIKSIYKIIEECGKTINGLKVKTCALNENAKQTVERKAKNKAIEQLINLSPSEVTILNILKQCFGEKDKHGFKKYAMLTLNLLFIAKKFQILRCFKHNNATIEDVLIKINDSFDFNLFGNTYQKIKIGDLS